MVESLADTILTMIRSEANNNPPPLDARIFRVYNSDYVDVECNGRIFKSVRCIGIKTVGNEGLLVFIDGDLNNQVFITSENVYGKDEVYTKEEVDELIAGGGGVPGHHTHVVADVTDLPSFTETEIKKGYILMKNLIRAW